MKKQGFTLIELMVVIVIMGILAAVAVPKLFAQIAKSKASEVGPAAGTYVHLQDAWYSEKNAVAADFTEMGYTAPPTNVFAYTYAVSGTKGTWTATSQTGLDKCASGKAWTVESEPNGTNGSVLDHTASAGGGDAECLKLTPSFTNIGAGS